MAWAEPHGEPAGIMNDDWRMVSFGDGFYVINHPDNPDLYLSESQGVGTSSGPTSNHAEQRSINPWGRSSGGGPAAGQKFRFNWNA